MMSICDLTCDSEPFSDIQPSFQDRRGSHIRAVNANPPNIQPWNARASTRWPGSGMLEEPDTPSTGRTPTSKPSRSPLRARGETSPGAMPESGCRGPKGSRDCRGTPKGQAAAIGALVGHASRGSLTRGPTGPRTTSGASGANRRDRRLPSGPTWSGNPANAEPKIYCPDRASTERPSNASGTVFRALSRSNAAIWTSESSARACLATRSHC